MKKLNQKIQSTATNVETFTSNSRTNIGTQSGVRADICDDDVSH